MIATACDTATDDDGKSASSRKKKRRKKDTPTADAYALGRAYGFACVFAMLGKDDALAKKMKAAKKLAKKLDVSSPTEPDKSDAMETLRSTDIADEIEDAHGVKARGAVLLGAALTDLFLGVSLESDVSEQLAKVKTNAKKAGVPRKVYADALDAAEDEANGANAKKLSGAVDRHFDYAS